MNARVRVGISGWNYPGWRGDFYPRGLPQRKELAYAAERFGSIEINGTFYSLQRPGSFEAWHDQTPSGFVFAVKGGRFITHMKRLRDVDTALANFFASGVLGLRAKLGPVLWQLPPNLPYEPERLEEFFAKLPRSTSAAAELAAQHDHRLDDRAMTTTDAHRRLRHAVEVRHESYQDPSFVALLRKHRIGLVVADAATDWPHLEDVTADFVYVRLHGAEELYASGYDSASLDSWADKIRSWLAGQAPTTAHTIATAGARRASGRDVFVYFDNDMKVRAPYDALALMSRLNLAGEV